MGFLVSIAGWIGDRPVASAQSLPSQVVASSDQLYAACRRARPGDVVRIAPGRYRTPVYVENIQGTRERPVVFEAAVPEHPPEFVGGTEAWHLSNVAYVVLRGLVVRGQSGNGINVDDGGRFSSPSHHVLLERLVVQDVGPQGNHDGIKLSGVDDFVVRACRIEGWGGQAVDMVGCHRGVIEACYMRGKPGFSQHTGPQAKGGSSDIVIRKCLFDHAGMRAVQLGGSTGLAFFRPQGAKYEAADICVEDCVFIGGEAAVSFVGVGRGVFRRNTVYRPEKWVMRILQETREPGFVRTRDGVFERNVIIFRRNELATAVNVGPDTLPGTFRFHENWWYCEDMPQASRPELPAAETNGTYGVDPRPADPLKYDLRLLEPRAKGYGAALPESVRRLPFDGGER
ncbi:hypothetical protein JCM19992_11910 [Thermostilla marina]